MCFSAEASFTASAVLTVVGVATQRKVHKSSQILFASVPLFFAVQQFSEGILWSILPGGAYPGLEKIAAYIFLAIAKAGWPLIIPLSILLMEQDKKRKNALFVFLALGIFSSLCCVGYLFFCDFHPVISGHHIRYLNDLSWKYSVKVLYYISTIVEVFYYISTVFPLFISSIKRIRLLGILMAGSCIVSAIFFSRYITSVWCFFAAILSIVVYFIISESEKGFSRGNAVEAAQNT
ncbi:MAG: hypothetical protein NT145_07645 [Elusimicrobia bacterium]|nr:hypothetical protein [Elusimicrobiota bacterium]